MVEKRYHCPRCGNENIIDYDKSFDCPDCELEFDKIDLDLIEDESSILSIDEKLAIVGHLEDTGTDNKKLKKND